MSSICHPIPNGEYHYSPNGKYHHFPLVLCFPELKSFDIEMVDA